MSDEVKPTAVELAKNVLRLSARLENAKAKVAELEDELKAAKTAAAQGIETA